ncbi:MAG TPA: hypothetical protein GXX51_09390 [Firmicutes bacterium]|nr:hypothetical protein [Bacillota bacterium]
MPTGLPLEQFAGGIPHVSSFTLVGDEPVSLLLEDIGYVVAIKQTHYLWRRFVELQTII